MRRCCEPVDPVIRIPAVITQSGTVDMASTATVRIAFFLVAISAFILGGCSGASSSNAGSSPTANTATSGSLSISGTPSQAVAIGSSYSFRPTASSLSGAPLTYSITNLPAWTTFDPATGILAGTPAAANVGTSPEITISVSDGQQSATLAAFSIDVMQGGPGVASLSWTEPPATASGAPSLAGYRIYYGESAADLTHVVDVSDPASTNYVVDDLSSGKWYFAIATYDSNHIESGLSAVVAVAI
jgi:hypothetical protein